MSAPALLGCAAVSLALALPVVAAAGSLEVQQRCRGAADAAALGAADAVSGWIDAEPCELAEVIADELDVRLGSCEIEDQSGEVRIAVQAATVFGGVDARARAGPFPFDSSQHRAAYAVLP